MSRPWPIILAAPIALLVLATPAAAAPAPAGSADHVVVVLLDRVSVDEFSRLPGVADLASRGGAGLLSAAGRGVASVTAGALTLSAGTRALAIDPGKDPFQLRAGPVSERLAPGTLGDAYEARTGRQPPAGAVGEALGPPFVVPDIELIRRLNEKVEVRAVPGLLGDALKRAGAGVATISLRDPAQIRLAPIVAMDLAGVVAQGALVEPGQTGEMLRRALAGARLVTVDAGNVTTAGAVLAEVLSVLGPTDAIVVLAPDPPDAVALNHTWLTPVAAVGPGLQGGRLTSPSTKRTGVVSNVDITRTLLGWLGVDPPPGLLGQTISSHSASDPLGAARRDFFRYERLARQRGNVFRAAIALTLVAVPVALATGLTAAGSEARRLARTLLLSVAAIPLAMLVEPLVASQRMGVTLLVVLGGALLIGAIVGATVRSTPLAFGLVAGIPVVVLAVDVMIGSPIGARSLLGFTVAGGTRFYGLASEEMGVVLAGILLALGLAVGRGGRVRSIAYAGALVLVLVFATPAFGAKFGMLLTAIPALAVAWARFEGREITPRLVAVAGGAVVLGVAALALAGVALGSAGSHIGTETRAIGQQGLVAAASVLARRAEVAFRLLALTLWTWPVALGVAAWAFFSGRGAAWVRDAERRRPALRGVLAGLVVAGSVALLVNDAGAVIVATLVLVAVPAVVAEVLLDAPEPDPHPALARAAASAA